jgi:hypothetical protein
MTALNFLAKLRVSHFVTSVTLHCVKLQEATDITASSSQPLFPYPAWPYWAKFLLEPGLCDVVPEGKRFSLWASCIRGPVFDSSRVITAIVWKGSVLLLKIPHKMLWRVTLLQRSCCEGCMAMTVDFLSSFLKNPHALLSLCMCCQWLWIGPEDCSNTQ